MKTLKSGAAALGLMLIIGQSASAALYNFTTSDNEHYTGSATGLGQVIPDNTAAGVGYSINFGTGGLTVSAVSVTFNLSGGYNGDITAYLSHGSQIAYLINANPSVSGSGMNVTFVAGTGNPIPTGGSGVLTGSSYTGADNLNLFNDTNPNGVWTLFFADLSPGDASTLNSFSLNVTAAVPEPVNVALGILGVLLVVGGGVRRYLVATKTRTITQRALRE